MKKEAEIIRVRYKYRRMILEGRVPLDHETALRLVGPDTAYHLYGKRVISAAPGSRDKSPEE